MTIRGAMNGGIGSNDFKNEHSDWVGTMEKMPQANGGVPPKITSHMTGNNEEGIEGGIDHKGIDKGGEKTDFHERKLT
jgi:hypothetical protein